VVKDLRILFEGESLDDYSCLKLGEIERTSSGGFTLREEYVPPCLYLSASTYLLDLLRRLLDILSAKRVELAGMRRGGQQGLVQFTMAEAANFWFLHTVNATLPILMHYHGRPQVHPERVYLEMARLVGELCTFAPGGDPKKVPPYQHEELLTTFTEMERLIGELLETVIPTRCSPVGLEPVRDSLWAGKVPDESLLETAEFYLAVSTGVPDEKVIREIPIKAKISSPDRVDLLIAQALRGVGLMHRPTPPSEIPVQPGRVYFQMTTSGDHWDAVRGAQALSIYIPPEFTDLRLELMAIKEE
jgi:type VI secretion system protein ImpJ